MARTKYMTVLTKISNCKDKYIVDGKKKRCVKIIIDDAFNDEKGLYMNPSFKNNSIYEKSKI